MKKIILTLLFVTLIISLTACGNKNPETEEEAPSVPDLTGQWKQINSEYEDAYQGAVIDGETIEIYWVSDDGHTRSLYWAGPFVAPDTVQSWSLQNDKSKTDAHPLASHDDLMDLTYTDGQIRYIASLTGADMDVQLEKTDWMPEENEKEGGTTPEDRTVSGFNSETNQTLSFFGLNFSFPAYFDNLSGDSDDTYMCYGMTKYGSHCYLTFTIYGDGMTQTEFDEQIPSINPSDTFASDDHVTANEKTEAVSVADLSGWLMSFRDHVDRDVSTDVYDCYIFNPETKVIIVVSQMFYSDDTTNYDYVGDFRKILDSAKLSS